LCAALVRVEPARDWRLGRAPFVTMMETANLGDRHDEAIAGRHDPTRNGRFLSGSRDWRGTSATFVTVDVDAATCTWRRSTDSPRSPASEAPHESAARPRVDSPWRSHESTRGHRGARPGVRCGVGFSRSRTAGSRGDAMRAPSPAERCGAPSASRAISATAIPAANDQ